MRKKNQVTVILFLMVIVMGAFAWRANNMKSSLVYNESLGKVAVTVDENDLTLTDLAFYIAYQEKCIQEQAVVYDPENTRKYWNLHTNEGFMNEIAKEAAVDMAVHDEIFYQLADAEGIELDAEEVAYFENEYYDFCSDLEDSQWIALGVTEETIRESMYKVAVANKYQSILAEIKGVSYEEFNFDGGAYQELLAEHVCVKDEKVWRRIPIGRITVNQK